MGKPRRQTMGRGPISEPVGRLIKIRPAQTTPLVSATGQRYSVGQPGPCKDGAISSSRPFMAERDVVWTACTRSEHPLSDPVFSKRVEIPMSIGSAASVLLQSLVTPRGLVNPARPAASCDGKPHRSNVVGRHGRWGMRQVEAGPRGALALVSGAAWRRTMCGLLSPSIRPLHTWVGLDERETETCQRPSRHPPNRCYKTNCGVSGRIGTYCGGSPVGIWQVDLSPTRTRDRRIWCCPRRTCPQGLGMERWPYTGGELVQGHGTHEQTAV